jgi:predicted ATPase
VIRRLYVHNYRCLLNFELALADLPSCLLIGRNGSGKTTISGALEILQQVAKGVNRVGQLVQEKDFWRGMASEPMRFEVEAEIDGTVFDYSLAFEFPPKFKELRVFEENFKEAGQSVYSRKNADVTLNRPGREPAEFTIDWHLVALPIIQESSKSDPISTFKKWLSRMLILSPVPQFIDGESRGETLEPNRHVTNFGEWFTGLLASSPAAYTKIDSYLRDLLPDLKDIQNPLAGPDSRNLTVRFASDQGSFGPPVKDLSAGEKCFLISALVVAAAEQQGPLLCFWDEPDSHLALSEVGHLILNLRRAALSSGSQFIATSHDPEAIRSFSDDNTLVLSRKSHLEPTIVRPLADLRIEGDLIGALIRGDVP